MVAVAISNLTKRFGGGPAAVQSVTLDIRDGEFLTLLGPSGCGKSTLLRMLAGLETPSAGEIRFADKPVTHLAPAQRNVAMVFQSYALYPHMTVAQNLGYPLRKRGVRREESARRIRETAALLQLDSLLDRKPWQLSGGQQQRVALGRAMIRDPAVYLFDEPLSNLDATLRAHMRSELIRLHAKVSGTMIFVTHDQVEAMTMSDRIAVMESGETRQLGTPEEIYHIPRTRFVAGFVGTPRMNFLEMEISREADTAVLSGTDLRVRLAAADGRPAYVGSPGPITLGIRAEDVIVGSGEYNGRVALVESLGYEQIVTLQLGETELVLRTAARPRLQVGESIPFGLQKEKLHFFSPVTGERVTL